MPDATNTEAAETVDDGRINYGPLRSYEIVWKSGHVETLRAHQVTCPSMGWFSPADPWFKLHGEFDGRWRLVLTAREEDIFSIRLMDSEAAADV